MMGLCGCNNKTEKACTVFYQCYASGFVKFLLISMDVKLIQIVGRRVWLVTHSVGLSMVCSLLVFCCGLPSHGGVASLILVLRDSRDGGAHLILEGLEEKRRSEYRYASGCIFECL